MAVVIVPIYKPDISKMEQISLKQCLRVLGKHTIIFIKPLSLNPDPYLLLAPNVKVQSFDDSYFKDIRGYNRLMMSEKFYEFFLDFQYMLIYQLDAFVFKDELDFWCKKKYDYIGAPWIGIINSGKNWIEKFQFARRAQKEYVNNTKQPGSILPTEIQFYNKVGNGGFSLRRVEKFYSICKEEKRMIEYYNNNTHHYFNEDVFWSLEVNRTKKKLIIPHYKTALHFSFEHRPDYAFEKITKKEFPFGCHAWDLFPEFWNPIIEREGYVINTNKE